MIRRFFLLYGVFALGTQLMAMTDISGNISDTTWTKANSPYHITGNTTVTNLTIEPGVDVLFDGDFEFNIDGNFIAAGSKSDTIRFRPNTGNSAGYPGIHVLSSAESIEFDYCRIEGANTFGIKIENSQTLIQNTKVLSINGNGIELSGSVAEIRRSAISDNSNNGIDISNSGQAYISNSRISRNDNSGIYSNIGYISLTNCIISHNTGVGIFLFAASDTLDFVNCTIAYQISSPGIGAVGGEITGLNSIIYHNDQSVAPGLSSVNISYSDIENPYSEGGSNNRHDDPGFTDSEFMRLSINSPCIDHGNPDETYNDMCFPPSLGTAINDMGAYGGPGACHWFDQMVVIPETLDFGRVTIADVQDSMVIVKNYRDSQLDISEIFVNGPDSPFFNISQNSASIAPFDSLLLPVSFSPDSARSYQASLNIITTADSINVPLAGQGVTPSLFVSSKKLDYDQSQVGTAKELVLNITNLGQGILRIHNLISSDPSFTIPDTTLPLNIASGSPAGIPVIFNPDTNLAYNDTLLILSNDPQKDSVYIDLVGEGTAPILTPSQSAVNFSKVLVSGDSVQNMTITNTGQDSLFISDMQIVNDPSGSFGFGDYFISDTLIPGATSDAIELKFQPETAGMHRAVLQLNSNDPFNDPYTVGLSGQGVKPVIEIPEQNFSFDQVVVGDSDSNIVWIKNTGDTTLFVNAIDIVRDHAHFSYSEPDLPLKIESGDSSDALQITYSPKIESEDSLSLTITSNDSDRTEIDVLVTATGIKPTLTTIPDISLTFGEIVVNDSLWQSVSLKNTGSGTLVIDRIYISGNDSLAFYLPDLTEPINLGPEDSSSVAVKFSPESQGVKNAGLFIKSNDPDAKIDSIALSGTGVVPQIHLSPRHIEFDSVYIGYSDSRNLEVSNTGGGILKIDSVAISDSMNFRFTGISAGDSIEQDSILSVQILFHPIADSVGNKSATLSIFSNDPDSGLIDVEIKGLAKTPVIIVVDPLEIEFDDTFVNDTDSALITISNRGDSNLVVFPPDFATQSGNFIVEEFGDSLIIGAMQNTNLGIYFTPQSGGAIYDTLLIYSNDPLNMTQHIPLDGIGIQDTSKVEFVVDISVDTLDFDAGNYFFSVEITKEGAPVSEAILYIRQGGQNNFSNLELIGNTDNIWSTEIPSEYVGLRGLEYYVQANYPGGSTASPDSGQIYPAISIVENLSGDFLESTKAQQYQMISLPLDAGDQSIDDLFGDILGPYDNTKYRIFDWDPSFEVYEESSDMNDTLPPGKSLWLISGESKTLAYANCASISSGEYYEINLHQGWNMIASPFAFNIDINMINKTPLQGEVIFEYDNGVWIPRQDSVLVPFRGYAVEARFASILLIPNTEAGQTMGKESLDSEQDWYIQLMASQGNLQDRYNFAGVNSRSKNGWDRFDYPEPPKIGEYFELYFKQEDKKLTGDYRTIGSDGYIYSFIIQSDDAGDAKIEVIPFNLPDNYTWQIIAPKSGVKYTSNIVHLSSGSQEYKLVVGKTDFVEHNTSGFKDLPESFLLAQNYPNPFNPETRVRFELPKASKVSLDIYDIMGRKIKSLSSDDYRQAGYYEVMWNGKNDQGRNVASGLYLLYLRTAEYKKAIKMILQR